MQCLTQRDAAAFTRHDTPDFSSKRSFVDSSASLLEKRRVHLARSTRRRELRDAFGTRTSASRPRTRELTPNKSPGWFVSSLDPSLRIGTVQRWHACRVRSWRVLAYAALILVGGGIGIAALMSRELPSSVSGSALTARTLLESEGLVMPTTYQRACASAVEASSCPPTSSGAIPHELDPASHFPTLRDAQSCPASTGRHVSNPVADGLALGAGPVRAILATAGDIVHGSADLDGNGVSGRRTIKTHWYVEPSYHGPVLIRVKHLDAAGSVVMGGSGALSASATPLAIPPGPTVNSALGWRVAPSGTWAKSAGCYA